MFLDRRSSGPLAQLVEQLTFNQWVTGSNPVRLTTNTKSLAGLVLSFLLFKTQNEAARFKQFCRK